jgi:CO dehydrogenase maturation factor
MGETIVITGRGGTGKSTFTSLFSRALGENDIEPLLIVDSDPDESLADMMGVNLQGAGKKSIAEVLGEILEERKMTQMVGMTPTDKIEPFLFQETLWEGRKYFDFLKLGVKWIEGCYCLPDRALSQIMDRWAENYVYLIVDSPAGVEHLNRRITKKVKDVFNILDPSKKSFDNARRTYKLMKEVDIEFKNYYLVGGYRFKGNLIEEAKKQPFEFLGTVVDNDQVMGFNLEGTPLLELPSSNPAFKSVIEIVEKAGYL